MFDLEFMRLAFAAGAVVGFLAPAVGFFLVQRGMSLIGDGVGHVAFAGVAAGYLLDVSRTGLALAAAVGGAVGVEWLRARHRAAGDQALALVFYAGIAGGVVLVSAADGLSVDLFAFLFGSILTVTWSDFWVILALGVGGLTVIGLLYRALAGVVLDEEGARVAGVPVAAAEHGGVGARRRHDRGVDADRRRAPDRGADGAPGHRGEQSRLEPRLDAAARDGHRARHRCWRV